MNDYETKKERFYNSRTWRRIAQHIRNKYCYICQMCGQPNATHVHHKIHISPTNIDNPAITLNLKHLTLLCAGCHNKQHDRHNGGKQPKTEQIRNRVSFDSDGNLISIDD